MTKAVTFLLCSLDPGGLGLFSVLSYLTLYGLGEDREGQLLRISHSCVQDATLVHMSIFLGRQIISFIRSLKEFLTHRS